MRAAAWALAAVALDLHSAPAVVEEAAAPCEGGMREDGSCAPPPGDAPLVFVVAGLPEDTKSACVAAREAAKVHRRVVVLTSDARREYGGYGGDCTIPSSVDVEPLQHYDTGFPELRQALRGRVRSSWRGEEFEAFCVLRWQALLNYLRAKDLPAAWHADSDVVFFAAPSAIAAQHVPLSAEAVLAGRWSQDDGWERSGHTAFVTRAWLARFLDHVRTSKDAVSVQSGAERDFTDMGFLAAFTGGGKDAKPPAAASLLESGVGSFGDPLAAAGLAVDWSMNSLDVYEGFGSPGRFGTERVTFKGGQPHLAAPGGILVPAATLHFASTSKGMLPLYLEAAACSRRSAKPCTCSDEACTSCRGCEENRTSLLEQRQALGCPAPQEGPGASLVETSQATYAALGVGAAAEQDQSVLLYDCRRARHLLFLHIPKNAGSSIEDLSVQNGVGDQSWGRWNHGVPDAVLRCAGDTPRKGWVQSCLTWQNTGRRAGWPTALVRSPKFGAAGECSEWHVPPDDLPTPNAYEDAEVFCVKRNPYDRLVSEFRYSRTQMDQFVQTPETCSAARLNEYIRDNLRWYQGGMRDVEDCHFIPQSEYIWGPRTQRQWCTHVLPYEDLQGSFDRLMAEQGYDLRLGPRKNQASHVCPELSAASFDAETRTLVQTVYADDFRRLGYSL